MNVLSQIISSKVRAELFRLLFGVTRILRLLRQEFIAEPVKKAVHSNKTWEQSLTKLRGSVSSTDSFMARKAEEKALER